MAKRKLSVDWATLVASVFLFLGFFFPPIAIAGKQIYAFDLALYGLALGGLVWAFRLPSLKKTERKILNTGLVVTGVLFVIFLHGMVRSFSLKDALDQNLAFATSNNAFSPFSWLQDGILFSRFSSWVLGCTVIALAAARDSAAWRVRAIRILDVFSAFCVVETIVAGLAYHTSIRYLVGRLYGYHPDYDAWIIRWYGTLASPVELGALLALGFLWAVIRCRKTSSLWRKVSVIILLVGLIRAHSFSSVIGVGAALCFYYRDLVKRHWRLALSFAVVLAVAIGFFALNAERWSKQYPSFDALQIHNKFANLVFRFQPWIIFLKATVARIDSLLLGLGFARFHTDNSYIHLFRTGGLFLLSTYLVWVWSVIQRAYKFLPGNQNERSWREFVMSASIFILATGLTIDVFIFRLAGTVFLMISALNLAFTPRTKYPKDQ